MKKIFYNSLMVIAAFTLMFFTSCDKNDSGSTPEAALPTLKIISPEIPAEGLLTEVGATTTFTLVVNAEAGLSTLKVGETTIKTYLGTEKVDTVSYDFIPLEAGSQTLNFVAEDALAKVATVDVALSIEEGVDLGYLLLDFAGALTSTDEKTVVDWDVRQLYTFGVTGSHGSSATCEIVNQQSQISFAQANPSADDNAKVAKIEKIISEGRDNWGGWAHVLFNLGSVIPAEQISALPTWDVANSTTKAGTKVIMVDAYYDATVVDTFTWSQLTALTDVWNADPTKGYKLDLAVAAYDPMGIAENGHDGAFYMGYSAYVGEPNKWVTVTFDKIDEGRTGSMFGVSADAPGADVINCVKIMPAPGYVGTDANPLYLKNLRIVDVE